MALSDAEALKMDRSAAAQNICGCAFCILTMVQMDGFDRYPRFLKRHEVCYMEAYHRSAPYEEIREYVKEHTGLNVSNLYIAQVKRKCGIKERQNYNKPKAENPKQLKCPPEKEKAIREALKYFKMI